MRPLMRPPSSTTRSFSVRSRVSSRVMSRSSQSKLADQPSLVADVEVERARGAQRHALAIVAIVAVRLLRSDSTRVLNAVVVRCVLVGVTGTSKNTPPPQYSSVSVAAEANTPESLAVAEQAVGDDLVEDEHRADLARAAIRDLDRRVERLVLGRHGQRVGIAARLVATRGRTDRQARQLAHRSAAPPANRRVRSGTRRLRSLASSSRRAAYGPASPVNATRVICGSNTSMRRMPVRLRARRRAGIPGASSRRAGTALRSARGSPARSKSLIGRPS